MSNPGNNARSLLQGSAGSPLSVTSAPKRSGSATPEVTSGGLAFETTR